jgi:hypothetical protein
MALQVLACNLARVVNIMAVQPLMAAMAHHTAGHPLRFAMATQASGWTKTPFRCYMKPGRAIGSRSPLSDRLGCQADRFANGDQ